MSTSAWVILCLGLVCTWGGAAICIKTAMSKSIKTEKS